MIAALKAWWQRRKEAHAEQASDAEVDVYRARIFHLTLEAAKVWEQPMVLVDGTSARVVNVPRHGERQVVAEHAWPHALDKLEMDVHRRIYKVGEA